MKFTFNLSDAQKLDMLWTLLNENFTEEHGYQVDYAICEVFDEYALCYKYETGEYERIYYTKTDDDKVEISERKKCHVLDVTEEEFSALKALREANNGTYAKLDETFEEFAEVAEQNEAFSTKISELETSVSTLTQEKQEVTEQFTASEQKVTSLTEELEQFKAVQAEADAQAKQAVIESYSELLDNSILETYTAERIVELSVEDLDKELAYELKKSNPSVFTSTVQPMVPKDEEPLTGVEAILSQYKK